MIRVWSLMRTSRLASRAGELLWVRGPSDGWLGRAAARWGRGARCGRRGLLPSGTLTFDAPQQ